MTDNPVFDRIKSEVSETDVVLFMKGTPMFPQCGFSAAVVGALIVLLTFGMAVFARAIGQRFGFSGIR